MKGDKMDQVNRTPYIPLYGKAQVSKAGLILADPKAEQIWQQEQFPLAGQAKSKWLCYFMAMRARVFDDWTRRQLRASPQALVLQIGCGLDSRVLRLGHNEGQWYDLDLPAVIAERRKYYCETASYHMLAADAAQPQWLAALPAAEEMLVVMEGLSMYLTNAQLRGLFAAIQQACGRVSLLMDVYTPFAARASKYKNPINTVGVAQVYGVAGPELLLINSGVEFKAEHSMTPPALVAELSGWERTFFSLMFAGRATQKIYRLFEYETTR